MAANLARDRAQARAAMEARLAQARATMTGMGLGTKPAQQPAAARATPARTQPHAAAAQARPAPAAAWPSRALALAMERTPQPAQPIPPDLAEPAPPARTPTPTPAVPERAIVAEQETPAGRSARLIAEGEQWLAEERAAGRAAPAVQAATAPAAPSPEAASRAAPATRAAVTPAAPAPEAAAPAAAKTAMPTGGTLMSAARRAGQAAASGVGSVTRLAVTALNTFRGPPAPEPPAAPTPTAAPPIPTSAPRPARDFSGAVQDVTERRIDGTVRFYTTEEEQQGNGRGLGGLERTLRQAGVPVERRKLFQDTDEDGQARSWLSLTCRRHDLELAVRRMGDAGADLVERLRRATARSARHIQAHIQPWRDRLRAERTAQGVTRPRPTPKRDGPGIA